MPSPSHSRKSDPIDPDTIPDDFLRFDYSDCKFPPAPAVLKAIRQNAASIHLYPRDPSARSLRNELARIHSLDPDWFLVTSGLDEAIDLISRAFGGPGREVMIPVPTFGMFRRTAEWSRSEILPLSCMQDRKYVLDARKILQAVRKKTALIWICNPNNPTGNALPVEEILRVADGAWPVPVAVDECFFEFASVTLLPFLKERKNLLVLRSFSKGYCLAGLRIGFIGGHPEMVQRIGRMKIRFSVNALAQKAALAALCAPGYYRRIHLRLLKNRDSLAQGLAQLPGIRVHDSQTNFILVDVAGTGLTSKDIFESLWKMKILVLPDWHPEFTGLGENFIRISVSHRKENKIILEKLREIINGENI